VASSLPSIKLADFGLARMLSSQTRVTVGDSVLGTPEYMSPEQARGDDDVDHRSDLFSAGVVLYEMLTGRTPFRADTPSAVIHQILNAEPADPRVLDRNVDPLLARLSLRLMAKERSDRLGSAREVLAAMEVSRVVRLRTVRRHKIRRAVVGLAGVVLLGLIGWVAIDTLMHEPMITDARVHPDASYAIQIRYDNDPEWRVFDFSVQPDWKAAKLACVVDAGRRDALIVVGLGDPIVDTTGPLANLVAYDARGAERWRMYLHDDAKRRWPGVAKEEMYWHCVLLDSGDLDGRDGDELIVVTSHQRMYPTLVAMVDPRTEMIRCRFWHQGHLHGIFIDNDYSAGDGPAIVAWGLNNRLDEPEITSRPASEFAISHYDQVSVLMVLDPWNMSGIGPPCATNPDILPAHAYAFLDLAYSAKVQRRADTELLDSEPAECGFILRVHEPHYPPSAGSRPWKMLSIHGAEGYDRVTLTIDKDLNIVDFEPNPRERTYTTKEDWQRVWHPIIQGGKYVGG
jgi:hypothetical protein